jgi:hypothetical protein
MGREAGIPAPGSRQKARGCRPPGPLPDQGGDRCGASLTFGLDQSELPAGCMNGVCAVGLFCSACLDESVAIVGFRYTQPNLFLTLANQTIHAIIPVATY